MNIPTAGELRKMDGVEITAVTDTGKEISWIIVVKWDEVGIVHNNPEADWWKVKKVPWYKYWWNLCTYWKPDDYITEVITKIISLGKAKSATLTYETQYLRWRMRASKNGNCSEFPNSSTRGWEDGRERIRVL